jgi:hypothetical protein
VRILRTALSDQSPLCTSYASRPKAAISVNVSSWPLAVCHLLTFKVTYLAINLPPRSRQCLHPEAAPRGMILPVNPGRNEPHPCGSGKK